MKNIKITRTIWNYIISLKKGGKKSVARITTINFKSKEDADESIKDYSEKAPSEFPEAEELLQIQSVLTFSRTDFKIGIGKWKNTSILKDKVILKINLFLFRE